MSTDPWLAARGRRPDARVRLFCLPHAGSGAVAYQPWIDGLPDHVDVCRVQLPGRETRFVEPALDSIEPLVEALLQGLSPHLDRPWAVFGHSMGAIVGFELVRAARAAGARTPLVLFASGHRAPHLPRPRPAVAYASQERFLAEVRWMGGTPDEVLSDPEMLDIVLPTLRADVNVWETYVYREQPPLECALTALGGREDRVATPAEIEGWAQHTAGRHGHHVLEGDHFFLETDRDALLRIVATDLDAALAERGEG